MSNDAENAALLPTEINGILNIYVKIYIIINCNNISQFSQ